MELLIFQFTVVHRSSIILIYCNMISQYNTKSKAFIEMYQQPIQQGIRLKDLFQPKTDLFSTRALIRVHFKSVRYFSQPIFILFSYLKNA